MRSYLKSIAPRLGILIALFVTVIIFRNIEGLGDFYAQNIYPHTAFVLSSISNIFPFSIGDLFIALSIVALITYPFVARYKGLKWKIILLQEIEYLCWIYVWFYLAWGLNYSQSGLLARVNVKASKASEQQFVKFAKDYVVKLNSNYLELEDVNLEELTWKTDKAHQLLMTEIVTGYHNISKSLAINPPLIKSPQVKSMMFSPLSSMVGVLGSMAPFFCEFTVNSDVLPLNYPATYAHEMAHQLGITSEAEANFYAYQVCTRSSNLYISFSGYFSILNHLLGNARVILNEQQYKNLYMSINPEIILIAQEQSKYWRSKYFKPLGEIQNSLYNAYLKSNKISSGTKNYSEVIGLLISLQK